MPLGFSFSEILLVTSALVVANQAVKTLQADYQDWDVASNTTANVIAPITSYIPSLTKMLYAIIIIRGIGIMVAGVLSIFTLMAVLVIFVVEFPWSVWFRHDL
ncbi:hypothetical protein F4821DRAFT_181609 [Hypoxylon rubiginosum]|uniref:Uncharacterized protein n=1 Tax=Hypoxylon rubiginosum TaxID=110542 RepID=A0ACC0CU96_9PEZI|nr:hypothetical protein F4821DRAFT_181609 [Hypoxylon rubiginosum]